VPAFESRILRGFENRLATLRSESRFLMEKMIVHLKNIFQSFKILSDRVTVDALEMIRSSINNKLEFIKKTERILTIASPLRNLKLGYSIITGPGGRVIKDISQLKKGERVKSKLAKGEIVSIIEELNK
ncbi:MAG: exodeoxyribonuclease VII large subunit, partial [Patescibacteria group bacterium]